ncbi:MAG TPA: DUF2520 domain-containing protein [Bacteroidota bacterium]|nr:DUF2520 domain-containing protein [Bacteroidota bacterium]
MIRGSRKLRVVVIGAGKVGTALAVGLKRQGYPIVAVISRSVQSARSCSRLVKSPIASRRLNDIPPDAECLVLALPDERIATVARSIARNSRLRFKKLIAFHTSGILTSEALKLLQSKGATVFSLHPIHAFVKLNSDASEIKGISYGFEGSPKAFLIAQRIVRDLRGSIFRVPKEQKIQYHIACVFAANYLTAVLGVAEQLLPSSAGRKRLDVLAPLATHALERTLLSSPALALTGPIARGSSRVVKMHIRELRKKNKRFVRIYQELGLQALQLAVSQRRISPTAAETLQRILKRAR